MWLWTLALHNVPRKTCGGGLCTTGQPPASATCIQWWCFRQCRCKGREGTDGGGLFLLFYSWSLVLFCLLTMQIRRNFVTFPVVLIVKGKKSSGIFKVLTSCLALLTRVQLDSVQVSFTLFKVSSGLGFWTSSLQNKLQWYHISGSWQSAAWVFKCCLSSRWNFGSVLYSIWQFQVLSGKGLTGASW